MTMTAFLTLVGDKLGPIKGSARQKTREHKIAVIAYQHLVTAVRSEGGVLGGAGMPTEKRNHGAFVVTKEIDRATPKLHEAHGTGERFSTFELQCFRVPPAGGGPKNVLEEAHWTVQLKGARVTKIRTFLANVRLPKNSTMPEYEEVEFSYDTIGFGWSALTGNAGEVFKKESAALTGDFTKEDASMIAQRLASGVVKDVGKEIGKQVAAFVKGEGKQMFLDALKEK